MSRIWIYMSMITLIFVGGCGGQSEDPVQSIGEEEEYNMIIGHGVDDNHSQHQTFVFFKDYVEEYSNGRITVDIFPNSQIGDDRELIEGVQLRTVTMAAPSTAPLSNFMSEFAVFDLPFLFEDREEAYDVLDGEIAQGMLGNLESIGIVGMDYWENGYRNLTNNRNEVNAPEDLQGMDIRTMEDSLHLAIWEAFGANPTPMAWGDVFSSIQQGVLDGQENPLSTIYSSNIFEVQDHLSLTEHVYSPFVVMINQEFYDSLPSDLQHVVDEGVEEAKEENRRLVVEEEETTIEALEEEGLEIDEFTDEQFDEFQEETFPVYEEFREDIGSDILDSILEEVQ